MNFDLLLLMNGLATVTLVRVHFAIIVYIKYDFFTFQCDTFKCQFTFSCFSFRETTQV